MRQSFPKIIFLALITLVLTGCPKKDDAPTPSDTVMGSSSSREDWINETDVSYSDGLTERDPLFRGMAPGEGSFVNYENTMNSTYFQFDNSSISPEERAKLNQMVDYLKAHPQERILIEGHCDWYGTSEYNLALGDRRANSVKQYLIQLGIQPNRIEILSKGSLDATKGLSKSDAWKDRRADAILIKIG